MMWTLATLASLTLAQQTDTTVAVDKGMRLRVENFGGEVVIRAGTDNQVRVRADHTSRDYVEVVRRAGTLSVKAENRRGVPQSVRFNISVPKWMAISVNGVYTDADIRGTEADVTVETVQGEVSLEGGGGYVSLQSVEGVVTLRGTRGRIEANSVNEGVEAYNVVGDLQIETVNGDVVMRGIDASVVEAVTVNGDIEYAGTLKDNGRYSFATHNGDIAIAVPDGANLTVGVSTYQGEFESSFEVKLQGISPKKRFTFQLGNGSGRLEIESFQGDIQLRRPGESGSDSRSKSKGKHEKDHEDQR
jgi:DUF4097 and DUF4098 domain-containing protein YvlB